MSIKIWNEFIREGIVMLNYYLLYGLDLVTAIVLCQIIAEYNHANNHNLNVQPYFLVNMQRMSDYLNLDVEEIVNALKNLLNLNLIGYSSSGIENTIIVLVKEDNIIDFVRQTKQDYSLHKWDWGLANVQNPKGQPTSFNNSTNALISFVNENMYRPETIPMVIYAFCNFKIELYEENGNDFLSIPNLSNKIATSAELILSLSPICVLVSPCDFKAFIFGIEACFLIQ